MFGDHKSTLIACQLQSQTGLLAAQDTLDLVPPQVPREFSMNTDRDLSRSQAPRCVQISPPRCPRARWHP